MRSYGSKNLAVSVLFSRLTEFDPAGCEGAKLDYTPLSDVNMVWTYPGHGPQTMGNTDPFELKYGTSTRLFHVAFVCFVNQLSFLREQLLIKEANDKCISKLIVMIVFVQKLSPCDLRIFDSSSQQDFGLPKLASGQEEEGELATMSLEFENLHRKSQCEMLIGGDDISALGLCSHVFFNVCFHSPSFPLCSDWQKSNSLVDREPQRN